jgi:hypothetical protein
VVEKLFQRISGRKVVDQVLQRDPRPRERPGFRRGCPDRCESRHPRSPRRLSYTSRGRNGAASQSKASDFRMQAMAFGRA